MFTKFACCRGLLSIFIMPLTAGAGQSVRTFLGLDSHRARARRREDVGWWRRWVRSFYSEVETNFALSR